MSDHVLHVIVELEHWGGNPPDPTAALAHIKDVIEEAVTDRFEYDTIEDTGMHLVKVAAI